VAQERLSDPDPYFSALIVDNMEQSIAWYTDNLGLETLSKKEYPEAGFKQANLKRGSILIELIELTSAVALEEAIPNYTSKTRTIGIFKVGFLISDFDGWIEYLGKREVAFHGKVVAQPDSDKRMVIIKDPDGNRIQLFER